MKFLLILVIFLLFVSPSWAFTKDVCQSNYWRPEGQIMEATRNYDKLAVEIVFENKDKSKSAAEKSKAIAEKLNAFKERFGYPIYSMITDRSRQVYKDRMVGDGMGGGLEGLVFLKNLNVSKESSGIGLDIFNEIKEPGSEQPTRTWKIPFGADVIAMDGENLIVKHDVAIICANNTNEPHKSVFMEIQPNGDFKFIPDFSNKLPEIDNAKFYEGHACRNIGVPPTFISGCNEYSDLKTKKKHFTFHTYIGPEGNYH